jgi:hypothetical protein
MSASVSYEAMILERVIVPDAGDLPPDLARYLLRLEFTPADHARIAALSAGVQESALSADEAAELDEYLWVNDLLALLQSKARRSLRS